VCLGANKRELVRTARGVFEGVGLSPQRTSRASVPALVPVPVISGSEFWLLSGIRAERSHHRRPSAVVSGLCTTLFRYSVTPYRIISVLSNPYGRNLSCVDLYRNTRGSPREQSFPLRRGGEVNTVGRRRSLRIWLVSPLSAQG